MTRLTCAELVERVTDFLDGALPSADELVFLEHVAGCPGCDRYLAQLRLVIRSLRAGGVAPG
jgi:anti-sigma factor RsiW